MWNTTIVMNDMELAKVVKFHLDQNDEVKIESCKGIAGEFCFKVLYRNREED